jgi:hypothetical protein
VGFRRDAFTADRLKKISPFIGNWAIGDKSYFMGTHYMYFPFFASEVRSSNVALRIAERENAHSMTLAVRAVVELFRLVKKEEELNRVILAFSIAHNDTTVTISGHYPVIDGAKTTYHRHLIRHFFFQNEDGRERWTAYQFTRNVYDIWMPDHFKRLCSVIDELPFEFNFDDETN